MIGLVERITIITTSVIVAVIIFEILMMWLRHAITLKTNKRSIKRLVNAFRLVFYVFLGIIELGVWGINIVAVLAGAGFLGIIVGLAVQVPLSNIFSGVYILTSKMVREDEKISINAIGSNINITGVIKHIGFSYTEMVDSKGKVNIVPNNVMVSSILVVEEEAHHKRTVH